MSNSQQILVSGVQLGAILGLSKSRISRLRSEGVLVDHDGKYDVAEAVQAYIAYLKAGRLVAKVAEQRGGVLKQQERRLRIANDIREGNLVTIENVEHVMSTAIQMAVSRFAALPSRCADRLVAISDRAAVHALLTDEVREIRAATSRAYAEEAERAAKEEPGGGRVKADGPPAQ